ncbi:hypothetical protein DB88DRAFT_122740 [Papiliotrema laurentii]|uniref:Uncharacterized protein n=1 Tax=Papiliotrema laurentii TaxID=5418 RepID=A0AAD9FN87_PAPLA|nr:hypothetical protein DB88DRAFT_122740 [Papiliotrema laurentii]
MTVTLQWHLPFPTPSMVLTTADRRPTISGSRRVPPWPHPYSSSRPPVPHISGTGRMSREKARLGTWRRGRRMRKSMRRVRGMRRVRSMRRRMRRRTRRTASSRRMGGWGIPRAKCRHRASHESILKRQRRWLQLGLACSPRRSNKHSAPGVMNSTRPSRATCLTPARGSRMTSPCHSPPACPAFRLHLVATKPGANLHTPSTRELTPLRSTRVNTNVPVPVGIPETTRATVRPRFHPRLKLPTFLDQTGAALCPSLHPVIKTSQWSRSSLERKRHPCRPVWHPKLTIEWSLPMSNERCSSTAIRCSGASDAGPAASSNEGWLGTPRGCKRTGRYDCRWRNLEANHPRFCHPLSTLSCICPPRLKQTSEPRPVLPILIPRRRTRWPRCSAKRKRIAARVELSHRHLGHHPSMSTRTSTTGGRMSSLHLNPCSRPLLHCPRSRHTCCLAMLVEGYGRQCRLHRLHPSTRRPTARRSSLFASTTTLRRERPGLVVDRYMTRLCRALARSPSPFLFPAMGEPSTWKRGKIIIGQSTAQGLSGDGSVRRKSCGDTKPAPGTWAPWALPFRLARCGGGRRGGGGSVDGGSFDMDDLGVSSR